MRKLLFLLAAAPLLSSCGVEQQASETKAATNFVCGLTPACNAAVPNPGPKKGFLNGAPSGKPFHIGHDMFFAEDEDQWVVARFLYGNNFFKKSLLGEEIKIMVLRGCGAAWETLGSTYTSREGQFKPIHNVADEGGSVYFKIPEERKLGLGRHRVRLVVQGDQTASELYLEIMPRGSRLFVSDVDGTLTRGELNEGLALLLGRLPEARPDASALFQGLAKKGYRPYYLSARAENLLQRTKEFLAKEGFPAGIVETSSAQLIGISGDKAIAYKTAALVDLKNRGFELAYAFGNSKVDDGAFAKAAIPAANRFFVDYQPHKGGYEIGGYADLKGLQAAPNLCAL